MAKFCLRLNAYRNNTKEINDENINNTLRLFKVIIGHFFDKWTVFEMEEQNYNNFYEFMLNILIIRRNIPIPVFFLMQS